VIRAAALGVVLALAAAPAQAGSLERPEYGRLLGKAAQKLEEASRSGERARSRAEEALRLLPEKVTIRRSAAAPAAKVDNGELLDWARREAKGGESGIRRAAAAVESLRQTTIAEARPAPPEAGRTLARVLARKEFRPSALAGLRERIAALVGRVILRILSLLPASVLNIPGRFWRIAGQVLLAAAGGLALYLVVRLAQQLAGRKRRPVLEAVSQLAAARSHEEWLAEAEARLKANDYRNGLRALHMAGLMKLDEGGHLRYEDSCTDGRFVARLVAQGKAGLAQALAELGWLFASVWYGRSEAGPSECATARGLLDRLGVAAQ
jgi:hypothetical protein